ncbi:MAG: hypothetical protein M3Z06_12860 [Actinomycetota bacterium]|nr:hypothetical protein [Actinomycetota bacterium]
MSVLGRLRSVAWPAIAVMALVAAGFGTAAATSQHRSAHHAAARPVASVAAARRRGPRGPRGFKGPRGSRGPRGPAGASGTTGAALGFAHVPQNGGVDRAKNITAANVQHTSGSGLYCFSGLSFNPSDVSVTLGADGNAVGQSAEIGADFNCPAGTQVSVITFSIAVDTTSGDVASFNRTDNGFYMLLN